MAVAFPVPVICVVPSVAVSVGTASFIVVMLVWLKPQAYSSYKECCACKHRHIHHAKGGVPAGAGVFSMRCALCLQAKVCSSCKERCACRHRRIHHAKCAVPTGPYTYIYIYIYIYNPCHPPLWDSWVCKSGLFLPASAVGIADMD